MYQHTYSLRGAQWSGWPLEDAKTIKGHPKRKSAGFVYVVEFSDGWVKVGRTLDARARLTTYAKEAHLRKAKVSRIHLSNPHEGNWDTEAKLINYCASQARTINGREYFQGIKFDRAVEFLNDLPQLLPTDEQVEAREQAAEKFAEDLRRYGPLGGRVRSESKPPSAADELSAAIARFMGRQADGTYLTPSGDLDPGDLDEPQALLETFDEIAEMKGVPIQDCLDMSWADVFGQAVQEMVRTEVEKLKHYALREGLTHMTESVGEHILRLFDQRKALWEAEAAAKQADPAD